MVEFVLWMRIECVGHGRFVAKVSAIPRDVEERCAPEERSIDCSCPEEAHRELQRLERDLSVAIRGRGNLVSTCRMEA